MFFFVLHGFTENYDLVPIVDALVLTFIYSAISLLIAGFAWLYYRNAVKASLLSFFLMAYHFFFGTIQDLLKKYFDGNFIARYSFMLPTSLLLFIGIAIWLKKHKTPFKRLLYYLNLLLILLITMDTGWLLTRILKNKKTFKEPTNTFVQCPNCKYPDIFFIILDEYSGNKSLKERFDFDNGTFENELRQRGFYVANASTSNYNYTPFSMASMLNMEYLDLNMKTKGQGNLSYCYRMIKRNQVVKFLETYGYKTYNYSFFDLPDQPAINKEDFLPDRASLITSQTLVDRLWKDILFNVATGKLNIKNIEKKIVYSHLHNNENFTRLTIDIARQPTPHPKFVYTHLMMPHHPYYFDSSGGPLPFESLMEGKQLNKKNYTGYLKYCNGKVLQLIDGILKTSSVTSPPIIILAGDHGFRYFNQKEEHKYCFMNLCAILLPNRNYDNFYPTMSTVNLFPLVLNSQFNLNLPLKKDSTIYLWE